MINKFNFLMGVLCLFSSTVASAQGTATADATINGSPYLEDAYKSGVIYYGDKNLTAPIRYNAFEDLIEYQNNGKPMVLDPSTTIKKVCVGPSTFVPLKYESSGKPKLGYFTVLDSGRVTLYSKKKIIYLPARPGGALDGSDQPAQYKRSADVYYYKLGDGGLQEVESIKLMIGDLPDRKEELTQYAKKEKISLKKENEIIKFVQYYNSLQASSIVTQ